MAHAVMFATCGLAALVVLWYLVVLRFKDVGVRLVAARLRWIARATTLLGRSAPPPDLVFTPRATRLEHLSVRLQSHGRTLWVYVDLLRRAGSKDIREANRLGVQVERSLLLFIPPSTSIDAPVGGRQALVRGESQMGWAVTIDLEEFIEAVEKVLGPSMPRQ